MRVMFASNSKQLKMAPIRPLAPELAEVARNELNENEETISDDIAALRSFIEQSPTLCARTDDQYILAFLRFCHYSLENAKQRLTFYYTYKTKEVDLIKNREIDCKLLETARSGIFATLPNPIGPGGPRIHYTRMGLIDTSKCTVSDLFRFHAFRAEIEINTDDNWNISGVVEILDFTKIPYSLLLQFDAGLFKRMNSFLEHGIPASLKATHIVHASKETQFILGLVRSAMKQKELLHVHSSVESLQKAIGKEYLPVELGGDNGTLPEAVANFEEKLLSFEDYFKEDSKYYFDSSCTRDKEQLAGGAEGSFRKLNFD